MASLLIPIAQALIILFLSQRPNMACLIMSVHLSLCQLGAAIMPRAAALALATLIALCIIMSRKMRGWASRLSPLTGPVTALSALTLDWRLSLAALALSLIALSRPALWRISAPLSAALVASLLFSRLYHLEEPAALVLCVLLTAASLILDPYRKEA